MTTLTWEPRVEFRTEAVLARPLWLNLVIAVLTRTASVMGRHLCDVRRPLCSRCVLRDLCWLLGVTD